MKTVSAEKWENSAFWHLLKANSIKTWKSLHLDQCNTPNEKVTVLTWGTAILSLMLSTWWKVSWYVSDSEKSSITRILKTRKKLIQIKLRGFDRVQAMKSFIIHVKNLVFILEHWETIESSNKWSAMSRTTVWKNHCDCKVEIYLEKDKSRFWETRVLLGVVFGRE